MPGMFDGTEIGWSYFVRYQPEPRTISGRRASQRNTKNSLKAGCQREGVQRERTTMRTLVFASVDTWWSPEAEDAGLSRMPKYLEDLVVLSDHLYGVGVPYNATRDTKEMVFGAMKATFMGNRVEDVVEMFAESWDFEDLTGPFGVIYASSAAVRPVVVGSLRYLHEHLVDDVRIGLVAAQAAIFRLQSTFQAAVLVVRQGMHFETEALARLVLEQLAWTMAVIDFEDTGFMKLQPYRCIGVLEELLPDAGRLYGKLSGGAHISPDATLRYLRYSDGRFQIAHRIGTWALVDCVRLLVLADYFCIISELTVRTPETPGSSFTYDPATAEWSLLEHRPSLEPLRKYKPIIEATLREYERSGGTTST
jgi:hypothetical protein